MTSNQIPIAYYDGNIFQSLYSSSTNDIKSSEYYIDVFRITNEFQEEHHRAFQNLIEKWANDFNVAYPVLLELLFEKQRRNFEQHALITDFIKDSLYTNDSRFTTLLRQQDLLDFFKLDELHVMESVYLKFFAHLFPNKKTF